MRYYVYYSDIEANFTGHLLYIYYSDIEANYMGEITYIIATSRPTSQVRYDSDMEANFTVVHRHSGEI